MKLKRILLPLLAAILLLSPSALAAPGDRNFLRGDEPFTSQSGFPWNGCAAGGALYMLTDSQIYVWRPGDDSPAAIDYAPPTSKDGEAWSVVRLFADGEQLRALCAAYDDQGLAELEVLDVNVDGASVSFGAPMELDADDLCVDYGDTTELAQIRAIVSAGEWIFADFWDGAGERTLYQIDANGEGELLDIENLAGIAPRGEGQLLIQTYDREAQLREFFLYDPEGDELTPACEPMRADGSCACCACSAESGRLFYLEDGFVMAAEGFDFAGARPVAELSASYPSEAESFLLPGDLYAFFGEFDGVCVRATGPDALPETRIVVQGGGIFGAMTEAYRDFNASQSDAVVVLREDYSDDGAILNDIVSRDDSVDVRVTMASSELYGALRERGYLAPLDSKVLDAAVADMYPAIRDALTLDGQVVALPTYVSTWTLGLDFEGFERIGVPRNEMPDNWPDFLDLLSTLPERIGEDERVHIFPEYATQTQVRTELIGEILESWLLRLRANGMELTYDSPELRALLEKAMALDLDALGVAKGGEDEEYAMIGVSVGPAARGRDYTLVNTDADCMLTGTNILEPALLSVIPGEEAPVPIDLAVVFVNPFSKHIDLAREYVAGIYEHLDDGTRYALSDALNDPVPKPSYEREIADAQRRIDEAKSRLESADPEDAPRWEEALASAEYQREMLEADRWSISPEAVEWYRAHGDRLIVKGYSLVNATDSSGEFYDLIQQFLSGRTDAGSFLKEIDRRVQMKTREG